MRRVLITLMAATLAIVLLLLGQATHAGMFKAVPTDHWTYDVLGEFMDSGIIEGTGHRSPACYAAMNSHWPPRAL